MNVFLANLISMIGGPVNGILGLVQSTMKNGFKTAIQFHKEGIAFARDMGLSAKEAQAYTDVLINRTQVLANRYGVSAEAIMQVQRSLSEATGKQLMLNNAQAEGFVQIDKMMGAQSRARFTEEIMNGMGGQINTVQDAMAKVYATASKQGLNAKKLTDKVAQNLSMANRLSFKNGIDGITKMAALSEKLGINMQSIESAASKFLDLDKAIESAAKMQMLGGSAAVNFGNPLTASFEANYDPERFAQRLSDSLASYATFDKNKGVANINGMNMDFVRNIAEAMGISTEDAAKMAKKQAEVNYKEKQFGGQLSALGLNEEQKNFLINNSQVKNGELYYTDTKGNEHNVNREGINGALLEEMQKFSKMSDKDILVEQSQQLTSIDEHITGAVSSVAASFAKGIDKHFPNLGNQIQNVGNFLQNYAEQWGADTGKVIGKAMHWINGHGPEIAKVASGILGFVSKIFSLISEYTKTALALLFGYKLLMKPALNGMFNGVTKTSARAGKSMGSTIWKASKGMFLNNKAAYSLNRGAGNGVFKSLLKAPKQSFSALGAGAKFATAGGAALGVGLGAYKAITADNNAERGEGIGMVAGTAIGTAIGGPVGAAVGGWLGGVGGKLIGEHWEDIKKTAKGAWSGIKDAAKGAWSLIPEDTRKSISSAFGSITWASKKVFDGLLGYGKGMLNGLWDMISAPFRAVGNAINSFKEGFGQIFNGNILDGIITMFKGVGKGIFDVITSPFRVIKSGIDGFFNGIGGRANDMWNNTKQYAKNMFESVWKYAKGVWSGIKNIGEDVWRGFLTLLSHVPVVGRFIKVPEEKHANGGIVGGNSYVGDKVITGLNSGEMVLTKNQQANLFAAINNLPNTTSYVVKSLANEVSSVLSNRNDVKAKPVGEKEYIYIPSKNNGKGGNETSVTVKDFNINLSGTLKLDAGNLSKNIDMNALLNDFQFVNALKEMIKTSINNDMNGGRFMNDLATLRGQTSSLSTIGR